MTGREKIRAALSNEGTNSFAAVTCYQGLFLRDHWEQATAAPWWSQFEADPVRAARPWVDMIERTGEDWFQVHHGHSRKLQEELVIETEGEDAWQVNRVTGDRTRLHRPPVGGHQPAPGSDSAPAGAGVSTPDALEAAMDRVYGARPGDFVAPNDGSLDLPNLLLKELGGERMPIAHTPSPWWWLHAFWGFSELMERMIETPELVSLACERLLQHSIHHVRRSAAAGAELIWIEDCMSDMISPAQCRDFSLKYVRPLVEAIREAGLWSVHYYCGRPDDRWEHLLDTGADALALEEGKKGFEVDMPRVAELVDGRMALLGNIDAIAVMEHGSSQSLRAEIERQCEAGRRNRGRFVVSIGSPVTPGTPIARVREYCDIVHEISS